MTTDDSLAKKLADSKRMREDNRQKLEDTDQLVERINNKLDQVKKLRQNRKKRTDGS
jgi:glutaredoxin 2